MFCLLQEYEIDKTLGIKGPEDVAKMGIAEYNKQCRGIVMRYSQDWEVWGNAETCWGERDRSGVTDKGNKLLPDRSDPLQTPLSVTQMKLRMGHVEIQFAWSSFSPEICYKRIVQMPSYTLDCYWVMQDILGPCALCMLPVLMSVHTLPLCSSQYIHNTWTWTSSHSVSDNLSFNHIVTVFFFASRSVWRGWVDGLTSRTTIRPFTLGSWRQCGRFLI